MIASSTHLLQHDGGRYHSDISESVSRDTLLPVFLPRNAWESKAEAPAKTFHSPGAEVSQGSRFASRNGGHHYVTAHLKNKD
jgi:hypothetical protein